MNHSILSPREYFIHEVSQKDKRINTLGNVIESYHSKYKDDVIRFEKAIQTYKDDLNDKSHFKKLLKAHVEKHFKLYNIYLSGELIHIEYHKSEKEYISYDIKTGRFKYIGYFVPNEKVIMNLACINRYYDLISK